MYQTTSVAVLLKMLQEITAVHVTMNRILSPLPLLLAVYVCQHLAQAAASQVCHVGLLHLELALVAGVTLFFLGNKGKE